MNIYQDSKSGRPSCSPAVRQDHVTGRRKRIKVSNYQLTTVSFMTSRWVVKNTMLAEEPSMVVTTEDGDKKEKRSEI